MADLRAQLRALAESARPVSSDEARVRAFPQTRRAPRRRAITLAAAIAVMIVVALISTSLILRSSSDRSTVSSPTSGIDLGPGACAEIATAPISSRSGHSAVWTGSEMIVWGGDDGRASRSDGAAYDPRTDTWRTIAASPLEPRSGQAATWTGTEMLVWGGSDRGGTFTDGAAYDPETDTWRTIAPAPTDGLTNPVTIWTGQDWIVAGGITASNELAGPRPMAYDPATDRWRLLPSPPDSGGALTGGVWTGSDAVFTVQPSFPIRPGAAVRLLRYAPTENRWRDAGATISATGDGTSGALPRPALAQVGNTTFVVASATFPSLAVSADDPTREIPSPGAPLMGTTLAAGEVVLQWGSGLVNTYLPTENRWIDAAPTPAPSELVQGESTVWTGRELLAWGGSVATGGVRPIEGGVAYRPSTGDGASIGCPVRQAQARRAKEPDPTPAVARHPGWRTVSAGQPPISVDVPPSWAQIAAAADSRPQQMLVVGSDPIARLRRGVCGSVDAEGAATYVEIAEHFGSGPYPNGRLDLGTWNGAVDDRPDDFTLARPNSINCGEQTAPGEGSAVGWTFRDQGRTFSATVLLGPDATEADRRRAVEVVQSLHVEPAAALSPLNPRDDEEIRSVVERWLTERGSADATVVEDFSEIADALRDPGPIALPGGFTDFDLTDISYRVDSVGRVDRRTAEFVYSVLDASGRPIFDHRVGRAVKVGGRWLVSQDTACAYLAVDAGGTGC